MPENITKVELEKGTMKEAIKDSGNLGEHATKKGRSGTTWFSWVTLVALLGATVALVVTVHRLNTQLAKERELHQDRLQELHSEASAARTEAELAASEKVESLSKQTRLEKQLKRAQDAIIRSEENLSKQASRSNDYQITASKLELEVVSARAELEAVNTVTKDFRTQVEQLQKLVSSQKALLAKSETDYERLSEKYGSLKEKNTKVEARMMAVDQEAARKDELLQEAQQQLQTNEDANQELMSRVKELESQVEILRQEGAQKETWLKDATQAEERVNQMQQEMTQKEDLLQRALQEAMQKEEQLKQYQTEVWQREEQLQQAQQEAREKAEHLQYAQQEAEQKEQHLQQAQQEAAQKREELHQAQQEAAQKEELVQRANGEIGTLRDTLSQRDAAVLDMQAKWQEAVEKVAVLEEQLRKAQDASSAEEMSR